MTTQSPLLDPSTLLQLQTILCDLLKDRVRTLEQAASDQAWFGNHEQSKQTKQAAREMDFMQREIFLTLFELWDASVDQHLADCKKVGTIERPELPQITPVSDVEVL